MPHFRKRSCVFLISAIISMVLHVGLFTLLIPKPYVKSDMSKPWVLTLIRSPVNSLTTSKHSIESSTPVTETIKDPPPLKKVTKAQRSHTRKKRKKRPDRRSIKKKLGPPQIVPIAEPKPVVVASVENSIKSVELTERQIKNENIVESKIADVTDDRLIKEYGYRISKRLRKSFHYPRFAILRNLQGRVMLELMIDSTGRIRQSRVFSSSGHSSLDNAALHTAQSISSLPAPPEELNWSQRAITVPLVYRLK